MQSVLTLVDALAEEARHVAFCASDDGLRAQAAIVRALVDERARRHPADALVAALHSQISEELGRLTMLAPEGAELEADAPMEVLVVEDEPSALRATALLARGLGYRCRTARNGLEALHEFSAAPASIVVSDWNMPEMDGLELCRALKRREPEVYFILVTAFPEQVRLVEEVRGGVDDFLAKPLDLGDLATRLEAGEELLRALGILHRVNARLGARRGAPLT